MTTYRLAFLSDIHYWRTPQDWKQYTRRRSLGLLNLALRRARQFDNDWLPEVVKRITSLRVDHVLITGDLTATSLPEEFAAAGGLLAPLAADAGKVSIVPGNHDRYTLGAMRTRRMEKYLTQGMAEPGRPLLRQLRPDTVLLGFDAARPTFWTARGKLPESQVAEAESWLAALVPRPRQIIVGCHYPVCTSGAFAEFVEPFNPRGMVGAPRLRAWLKRLGPAVYCHGHVHQTFARRCPELPEVLMLSPGCPTYRRRRTHPAMYSFVELIIAARRLKVLQHQWADGEWRISLLADEPEFFN